MPEAMMTSSNTWSARLSRVGINEKFENRLQGLGLWSRLSIQTYIGNAMQQYWVPRERGAVSYSGQILIL